MKRTNKSACGTSFWATTIRTTVNTLERVLGESSKYDDGKTTHEWTMETKLGDVFTVYDWKEHRELNKLESIEFHIGGNSSAITELAKSEILEAIDGTNKTVVIADLHGLSDWKLIVDQNPDATRFVFLGDYFDSFDISGVEQIHNFKEIINFKESTDKEVIMLVGNHDHHYFSSVGYTGTSGYQRGITPSITQVLEENAHHLQMAYRQGEFLFSHAGVSEVFMDQVYGKDAWNVDTIAEDLNELWKHKPKAFVFNGTDPSGNDIMQTPIWIRPRSLMKAGKMGKKLCKKYIQVVGHTVQYSIDTEDGRYYFVDTLPTSGEYMIITNNSITFGCTK